MKNKIAFMLALSSGMAHAQTVYQPPGENLTYGSSSNPQSLMSSIANPAAAAAQLGQGESQYRFGLLSLGLGYEIGNVSDLFNQIDSTQQTLTNAQSIPAGMLTGNPATDAPIAAAYLNANVINPVNALTASFQRDGSFTGFGSAHVPFTPFVIVKQAWGGGLVFDASGSAIASMTVLADPVPLANASDAAVVDAVTAGSPTYGSYQVPANDSTMLVKAAVVRQFGVGYSRSVMKQEASGGELTAGARLKHYQVDLERSAVKVTSSTGAQDTFDLGRNYTTSTGWGLDLGALWSLPRYRVGAWINNLNTPKFDYNTVDTTGYTNTTVAAQINADGSYEMKPQLQLEGAVFSESRNWVLNLSLDANPVKDPVGREFQWFTLGAGYAPDSFWIPGVRVGYRVNKAGSQLNYITFGLSLFKALTFDLAYTPETVTDTSGQTAPRSVMANLGLFLTF